MLILSFTFCSQASSAAPLDSILQWELLTLESINALKSRALEVALSNAEASALETNGITSLERLAFPACHPGQTPTEAQLQPLLHPIPLNPGNTASLKGLIFES